MFLNENLTNDDFFERNKTCTIRNQSIKREAKMKTKKMQNENDKNIWKGIVAGAVGGLVASFVMTEYQVLTSKISESDEKKKPKSKKVEPANVKMAEMVSENVFDHKLKKSEKEPAGEAMHYLMGGVSGAIYGATAEMTGMTTMGAGLPFGSAVWAIADDVVVPALGLSKSPTAYPLSTHAYALTSHWVYGLTTELVRKAVRKIL